MRLGGWRKSFVIALASAVFVRAVSIAQAAPVTFPTGQSSAIDVSCSTLDAGSSPITVKLANSSGAAIHIDSITFKTAADQPCPAYFATVLLADSTLQAADTQGVDAFSVTVEPGPGVPTSCVGTIAYSDTTTPPDGGVPDAAVTADASTTPDANPSLPDALVSEFDAAPIDAAASTQDAQVDASAVHDAQVTPDARVDASAVHDAQVTPDARVDAASVPDARLVPDAQVDATVRVLDAHLPPDATIDAARIHDARLPPDAIVDARLPPDASRPDASIDARPCPDAAPIVGFDFTTVTNCSVITVPGATPTAPAPDISSTLRFTVSAPTCAAPAAANNSTSYYAIGCDVSPTHSGADEAGTFAAALLLGGLAFARRRRRA